MSNIDNYKLEYILSRVSDDETNLILCIYERINMYYEDIKMDILSDEKIYDKKVMSTSKKVIKNLSKYIEHNSTHICIFYTDTLLINYELRELEDSEVIINTNPYTKIKISIHTFDFDVKNGFLDNYDSYKQVAMSQLQRLYKHDHDKLDIVRCLDRLLHIYLNSDLRDIIIRYVLLL